MNERITSQIISEALAKQLKLPKRTSDNFMRAFIDTIIDGLLTDGIVKVKGLGTFKVSEMSSRESVNVTNGERVTIAAYRKISFTPEESVTDKLTNTFTPPASSRDELSDSGNQGAASAPTSGTARNLREEPAKTGQEFSPEIQEESAVTEQPVDKFSGIDVLISTPESLDEARELLSTAQKRADDAQAALLAATEQLKQAREAAAKAQSDAEATQARAMQLQERLDNIESNRKTTLAEPADTTTPVEIQDQTETQKQTEATDNVTPTAEQKPTVSAEQPDAAAAMQRPVAPHRKKHSKKFVWWILAIIVVIGAAGSYLRHQPQLLNGFSTKTQETAPTAKPATQTNSKPHQPNGSRPAVKKTTAPVETKTTTKVTKMEEKTTPAQRPASYCLQKGQSLTDVSVMFYQTKDSVRAIIRKNNFKNPDNIFVGTEILLP